MSILTIINGTPVFDTILEAERWAITNGTQGYHEHLYNGQTGYMGGTSHPVDSYMPEDEDPSVLPVTFTIPDPANIVTTPPTIISTTTETASTATPAVTTNPTTPSGPGTEGY